MPWQQLAYWSMGQVCTQHRPTTQWAGVKTLSFNALEAWSWLGLLGELIIIKMYNIIVDRECVCAYVRKTDRSNLALVQNRMWWVNTRQLLGQLFENVRITQVSVKNAWWGKISLVRARYIVCPWHGVERHIIRRYLQLPLLSQLAAATAGLLLLPEL